MPLSPAALRRYVIPAAALLLGGLLLVGTTPQLRAYMLHVFSVGGLVFVVASLVAVFLGRIGRVVVLLLGCASIGASVLVGRDLIGVNGGYGTLFYVFVVLPVCGAVVLGFFGAFRIGKLAQQRREEAWYRREEKVRERS